MAVPLPILQVEPDVHDMSTRSEAALRWYCETLLTGTTEEVLAADAEVDAATKEEQS
jgi:hypothetical protein